MTVRSIEAVIEARRAKVATLLALHKTRREIYEAIKEEYGVGFKTIDADIAEVMSEQSWMEGKDRERRRANMRRSFGMILGKAMARAEKADDQHAAAHFRVAMQALEGLCKLDGLYAPSEVTVGGEVSVVHSLTTGDRRARIEALLAKARGEIMGPPEPKVLEVEATTTTTEPVADGGGI